MMIKHLRLSTGQSEPALTLASLFGALAASSCCLLPVVLFSLGIGGAWIAIFTRLAPYQSYILAPTLACLAIGYWRLYRARSCTAGENCSAGRSRLIGTGLILATMLVTAVLGIELITPLLADF
jgi:mercuric ion transport protein